MRLGCTGCFTLLLVLGLVAGGVSFGVSAIKGAFEAPEVRSEASSHEDGLRAQQKIFALVAHGGRQAHRGSHEPIVLSASEISAFLSRHLADVAEVGITDVTARLPGDGVVEFAGRVPLRALLRETMVARGAEFLASRWLDQRVWLRLRARPRVDPSASRPDRRYLRLDVERFWLGRQRLPTVTLWLLLAPATVRVFQWPLPDAVHTISVETGQVVIRSAS